jgi:hypothetical protein
MAKYMEMSATRPRLLHRGLAGRTGVVGIMVAIAACGADISGPTTVDGLYALQDLNNQPLPYDHGGLGCCTYLSGSLELSGSGYEISITARNRNTGLVFSAVEWGKYVRQASSLTFARDSFVVAPFLLDVGTISAATIRVAFGGEGPGSSDQFQAGFVRVP